MEWEGLCERKCFKRWRTKDLLPDDRVFNARYVYKLKLDATSGLVSRFKARLIVQGFRMNFKRMLTTMIHSVLPRDLLRLA